MDSTFPATFNPSTNQLFLLFLFFSFSLSPWATDARDLHIEGDLYNNRRMTSRRNGAWPSRGDGEEKSPRVDRREKTCRPIAHDNSLTLICMERAKSDVELSGYADPFLVRALPRMPRRNLPWGEGRDDPSFRPTPIVLAGWLVEGGRRWLG